MVGKYTDVILDYVQSEGGQQAMALLKNDLCRLLIDPKSVDP